MTDQPDDLREKVRRAWDANAAHWDETMGSEGNDFVNMLVWPETERLLDLHPAERVLDVACGNGLYALRIADLGAQVVGFDFSAEQIARARQRSAGYGSRIAYHVIDATDLEGLLSMGVNSFGAAVCNMALFDMAHIEPLAKGLFQLLRPGGRFVFSVMHPCFNGLHSNFLVETGDDGHQMLSRYFLKLSGYLTPFSASGIALRGQPEPQLYFHRPLHELLRPFLDVGFVLDALEERAFPPGYRAEKTASWSGNYSEFPPVLIGRFRR